MHAALKALTTDIEKALVRHTSDVRYTDDHAHYYISLHRLGENIAHTASRLTSEQLEEVNLELSYYGLEYDSEHRRVRWSTTLDQAFINDACIYHAINPDPRHITHDLAVILEDIHTKRYATRKPILVKNYRPHALKTPLGLWCDLAEAFEALDPAWHVTYSSEDKLFTVAYIDSTTTVETFYSHVVNYIHRKINDQRYHNASDNEAFLPEYCVEHYCRLSPKEKQWFLDKFSVSTYFIDNTKHFSVGDEDSNGFEVLAHDDVIIIRWFNDNPDSPLDKHPRNIELREHINKRRKKQYNKLVAYWVANVSEVIDNHLNEWEYYDDTYCKRLQINVSSDNEPLKALVHPARLELAKILSNKYADNKALVISSSYDGYIVVDYYPLLAL